MCCGVMLLLLIIYIYIVDKKREFSENKVLNIVSVELKQLKVRLLPQGVTLCFTYADNDDDLQTGVEGIRLRQSLQHLNL